MPLFIYFSSRLTSNDKYSNEELEGDTHILEVIKRRSDFAENEMWRFIATLILNKKLLTVFWLHLFLNKSSIGLF